MKREPEPDELEVEIVSIGDDEPDAEPGAARAVASEVAPDVASDFDRGAAGARAASDVEELRGKLAEAEERALRLRAEFDNFRKRLEREREDRERRALARPFLDLLPVVDNLERAAAAPGGAEDLRRGVDLIARQLVDLLRRYGLAEIPSVGKPFDPRLHEAVTKVESDEHEVPTVIAELQRGYWLNDKLLRPAMVEVAVPAEDEKAAPADEPEAEAVAGDDGGADDRGAS
jgi:molecular chaperone GrpE